MARWTRLARFISPWLLAHCATLAKAKMVMGIANGDDYHVVSSFCFTFPEPVLGVTPENGHIHSQTIVSSSGHKFLVINASELSQGRTCQELVARAKVIEPLTERTREVIAYDLTLNVEPSMNGQHIVAVIARCGQSISAEYIVEFTNPGGYFQQHFACSDLGLMQAYIWFSLLALGLAPIVYHAGNVLHRRQAHNDLSAIFFTAFGFFCTRLWLFTIHLLVYSGNGLGLGMLLFVAQFLDFLSTTMLFLVLAGLVHGVYVTRPCVPPGSAEGKTLMQVAGGFTATYLLSTLVCGFKVDGQLTPFGVLRNGLSLPYVLARAAAGVFCFRRGLRLAQEGEAQSKRPILMKISCIALAWTLSLPVVMLFSGDDSWHNDAFLLDTGNFAAFSALLYELWPSRFGALFGCVSVTERRHPYAEFGLSD